MRRSVASARARARRRRGGTRGARSCGVRPRPAISCWCASVARRADLRGAAAARAHRAPGRRLRPAASICASRSGCPSTTIESGCCASWPLAAAGDERPSRRQRRYLARAGRAACTGSCSVPGDKSISHRALMLGGIAEGDTEIEGFLASEDCLATLAALRALGVAIERPAETEVRVHGVGPARPARASAAPLDMGNAGTAMRLFMGLLAGQRFDSTLIGDASLMRRPMERVAQPLRAHGRAHRDPARAGRRCRSTAVRDCAASTTSCRSRARRSNRRCCWPALYARRHAAASPSRRRRAITPSACCAGFGVALERERQRAISASRGGQRLRGCAASQVPGDFSSAAFFLVAGCLAARAAA